MDVSSPCTLRNGSFLLASDLSIHDIQELIQNAEDAGARDVKFLYDKTQYGTDVDKLHHPELRHFQVCLLLGWLN